ncbi:MAG: SLC13 family permease [Cyclobacteriaceae bacterium]
MNPEVSFLIGLVALILLAAYFKVNAMISLLISSLIIGLISGIDGAQVIEAISIGFGGIVSKIGIVIIFGVLIGKLLEDTRGAEKLARSAIKLVGERKGPFAMAISGFLIAVPVYSDVGYVILSPLTKALSRKSGVCLAVLSVSLSAGLLATHVFVPPTPGPFAVVGLLGIDMGDMIIWGTFAAIVMTLSGWIYAQFVMPRYLSPIIPEEKVETTDDVVMPNLYRAVLPLIVPILLILLKTTTTMLFNEHESVVYKMIQFVGDPVVAMGFGAIVAIVLLREKIKARFTVKHVVEVSIKDAGPIIFITAAGGSLGEVLEISGAGQAIAERIVSSGLPFILIPFLISGILKTIQGSGTVAIITAATLCLPISESLSMNPVLIAMAAGSGARLVCHVNDSYFWVFTNMNQFDTTTGLKTLSAANIFMAFGGLLATWIASFIV